MDKQAVQIPGVLLATAVVALVALAHYLAYAHLLNDVLVGSDSPEAVAPELRRTLLISGAAISLVAVLGVFVGAWLHQRRSRSIVEQLKESEARYRTMIQSMDEGIVVIDKRGRIRSVNPAAERLFGYRPGNMLGRHVRALMPPKYANRHDEFMDRYLETGEKRIIGQGREVHGLRRDGSEFPMQLFVSEMAFDGQRLFTGIVHDISERKKAETEAQEARQRAEHAAAAKSQFLANMSHEIRTPMNGVLGLLELLSRSDLGSPEQEYVRMARQSSVSLLKLIDGILDLSKIEAGRIDLEYVHADLHELIEEIASIGASMAIEKDLRLNCYIAPDIPKMVSTDPARLRQVLLNLIGNAVKFTDHGEVNLNVHLAEKGVDSLLVQFKVEDTGVGIEETHLQKLFEPFVQADNSITRKFGGTGLGLTISRRLVALMGGDIRVRSEPGVGSTFAFTARLGAPGVEEPEGDQPSPDWLQVMVVDDNANALKNIQRYLHELGVGRIDTARDVVQSQRLVEQAVTDGRGYGLVLIKDPIAGVNELIASIRDSKRGAQDRIVAIRPVNAPDGISEPLQTAHSLAWPVRRSELEALVRALAERPPDDEAALAATVEPKATGDWSGLSVLLAEDNPVNQLVCQRMLERFGINPEIVENGQQAVERAEQQEYDLILMDCQMPVMDGYTAARQIRARELKYDLPRTTIVAVTAHAMEGDREMCLKAGMDAYVKKPYRLADLEAMLSRWCA